MAHLTAHIINHTHWDREWFLTSVYTNAWIPGLVDRLAALVERNPAFHFLLDGQTLVVEDLLQIAPDYRKKIEQLVRDGNLLVGPYYCQPDWRLAGGETLLRNLLYGHQDVERYGGQAGAGWLVDTFGHISQAPQLHNLFGIDSVYIWRGAPKMAPYFSWRGPDGSQLFTVNLFGGYRNLYGVAHVPELAADRLQAEVARLRPYYPTPDIPLFDGYDLEDNPEDPLWFYHNLGAELPAGISVQEATPAGFAREIATRLASLPAFSGELNSGKYGAVFPGTLSTRAYLKVMARDCEQLLYQLCEPLGVLAWIAGRPYQAGQYQAWSRALLRNAVHDCICGVSIDQVHEKMEFSYRQVFDALQADLPASLAYILADFAPGTYAVSASPFLYEGWHVVDGQLCHLQAQGIGVWPVGARLPIQEPAQPREDFTWQNRFYAARILSEGTVQVGQAVLGALLVSTERGDAYSAEPGPPLGVLRPAGPPLLEQVSPVHAQLRLDYSASWGEIQVAALVRLTFDQSPLIRWQIELDTRGADFRLDVLFATAHPGQLVAGMPFDQVARPTLDRDLLPRELDADLAALLLGQRELGATTIFPFHDFVAVTDGATTAAVLAKGLHSYQADENGEISITLHRSVEWLAKPDLEHRVGDAGPFFYVPGARSERRVTHELAAAFLDGGVDDPPFQALVAGFQNPPLVVTSSGGGQRTSWEFLQEDLPLSSLHLANGRILARVFNPTARPVRLSKTYPQLDVFGNPLGSAAVVPPKKILTLALPAALAGSPASPASPVALANPPAWRVGPDQGLPDPAIIAQLKERAARLEGEIREIAAELSQAAGRERYHRQRQIYVLQREQLEYRLSARLNELKLAMAGQITRDYLYKPDEEVAEIGRQLNQLRIKRRIYDYVVQVV